MNVIGNISGAALVFAAAAIHGPAGAADFTNAAVPSVMDTAGAAYVYDAYSAQLGPGAAIGNANDAVSFTLQNAAAATFLDDTSVGKLTGSDGNSVLATGSGTLFDASLAGYLYIGNGGSNNSLTVAAGAQALAGRVVTSYSLGSHDNAVTVTGSGSKLVSSSPSLLGYLGTNSTVTVSGGAVFECQNRAYISFKGAASGGAVSVAGSGSKWTVAQVLCVGNAGTNNTLTVSAGGNVTSIGAYVGTGGGRNDLYNGVAPVASNNTTTITGAGSRWSNSGIDPNAPPSNPDAPATWDTTFYVGKAGSNNLLAVADGGCISNTKDMVVGGNGTLSNNSAAQTTGNTVSVTGSNSMLLNEGSMVIGTLAGASSTLEVSDHALARIGSQTTPGSTLTIGSGSRLRLDGGFLALVGEINFSDFLGSAFVSDGAGGWNAGSLSDFSVNYVADWNADTGTLTGGLYHDLGGYTIITTAVPEPSSILLVLSWAALAGAGKIALRRKPRTP